MNYKMIILAEARLDFKKSFEGYKDIHPKLGERFKNSFKESLKIIKSNPLSFQIRYKNNRVILLEKFPYLIHFSVDDKLIQIKAVFHTSRNSEINKIV